MNKWIFKIDFTKWSLNYEENPPKENGLLPQLLTQTKDSGLQILAKETW